MQSLEEEEAFDSERSFVENMPKPKARSHAFEGLWIRVFTTTTNGQRTYKQQVAVK